MLRPFGWTRLTGASEIAHHFDGARILLVGRDPGVAPFTSARVRDGQGGLALRPVEGLGFVWRRARDGNGWELRTSGAPTTMEDVAGTWGALARKVCGPLGVDPVAVLTTIACEVGAAKPDEEGFVKAPRTEKGYPNRSGENDPGDFERDDEDWKASGGAHSSHGLMQTLIATAVKARPDLFRGVTPARYRAVLWTPECALLCGATHLASFAPAVLADPLRTRVTYGSGSVRVPATARNPWGAVVFDDLVPMQWIAYWNDGASLSASGSDFEEIADDAPFEGASRGASSSGAWVFAAFSFFALSVAAAWGASHFTKAHARQTARAA